MLQKLSECSDILVIGFCLFFCFGLFCYFFISHLINSLFFSPYYQIYKQPAFGRLNYNMCLLDGYTPSMFSNGVAHEKQKTFLMQICKIAQQSKIFEKSVKLIKEYSTIWQNEGKIIFSSLAKI